uniref:EF-hand domain-containing protein n=1 Tax=Ascaris lumbricoides TaxID=6252 RepID=A0A0M3HWX3_ASCLU
MADIERNGGVRQVVPYQQQSGSRPTSSDQYDAPANGSGQSGVTASQDHVFDADKDGQGDVAPNLQCANDGHKQRSKRCVSESGTRPRRP